MINELPFTEEQKLDAYNNLVKFVLVHREIKEKIKQRENESKRLHDSNTNS
jgi:hypothetical protein